jgi:hypothetical protein
LRFGFPQRQHGAPPEGKSKVLVDTALRLWLLRIRSQFESEKPCLAG